MLSELRSRQAQHDERTATRRYRHRLRAPDPRSSPEHLIRTLDAMLTQLADVVDRLQGTIEIQGELLDRVADRVAQTRFQGPGRGRGRAAKARRVLMPDDDQTQGVGVNSGVNAGRSQG
jgi:uncharacterized membrane protein